MENRLEKATVPLSHPFNVGCFSPVLLSPGPGAEFLSASVEGTGELGSISFPDGLDCLLEAKFLLVYLPV